MVSNVFSGVGSSKNKLSDSWKKEIGPAPKGTYLIGQAYKHPGSPGENEWFRLYGPDGVGGFSYQKIPITDPNGNIVYRGLINLHTGLVSIGCVTVKSDVSRNNPKYPESKVYNKLKNLLKSTKPLIYKGSEFSGKLIIKE